MPLFFLSGMEGRMLIPLGIAFIVALFASTVVALTLTPVLCSYLLKGKAVDKGLAKEAFLTVWIKKYYRVSLLWVLSHKKPVILATLALFVGTIGVFPSAIQRRVVHHQRQLVAGHLIGRIR